MNVATRRSQAWTILGAALTLTSWTITGCHSSDEAESGGAPPPPTVTVVEAARTNVPIITNASNGTTRALEEVVIRARVKGFLKEQHFQEGQNVKKGDLLLVIDEEPFKVKLAQTEAKLSEARASLSKAETSKSREVSAAQVALDQASVTLATVEDRRERSLLARGATPKEEVDRKEALLKRSQAQLAASQANFEQAKADYDINILAARASVEEAQANVENAKIDLSYCRMSAPIDGRVGELKVKIGNLVGSDQSTELVTIEQLDPMGIDFRPAARFLPRITPLIAKGLKVDLIVQGDRPHPVPALADFVDNRVDPATSTVLVKAKVPNPDQALLPGEYVRASAVIGEYKDVVVVPERAVLESQEGPGVYIVDGEGKVERVKVEPIDTVNGLAVIEKGLDAGQKVVVDGIQLIRRGMKVETRSESLDLANKPSASAEAEAK